MHIFISLYLGRTELCTIKKSCKIPKIVWKIFFFFSLYLFRFMYVTYLAKQNHRLILPKQTMTTFRMGYKNDRRDLN